MSCRFLSATPSSWSISPGSSALMEASSASGLAGSQSATVGVASASTGKRRVEERHAIDKRLRYSVRQTESAYRYRDIVVRKQDGFTHILLSTKTENNTLNPDVRVCCSVARSHGYRSRTE